MRAPRTFGWQARRYVLATVLLIALGAVVGSALLAEPQTESSQQAVCSGLRVVQGRVTATNGDVITVKMPDQYPGGPGIHAQVVVAGSTFRVDASQARLLLPDGRQVDKLPLAVGDWVLIVITGPPNSGPLALNAPRKPAPSYSGSIVERIVRSDRITTH